MGKTLNLHRKNRDNCILSGYICISDRDISICSLIQISLLEKGISIFKIQISLLELVISLCHMEMKISSFEIEIPVL